MAYKRTRKEFEADLQAQQSPFVFYGTALPPLDPAVRDDGSYVPVWKQEVTDERGRKRLHGAFTGGFSAGYFNTVGSKEGWTPSTFVSSRTNRQKDAQKSEEERRAQYMDDEDLADAAEAQHLETRNAFSGLGGPVPDNARHGLHADLFQTQGDTVGRKLLRKMGWKDGQGVGAKVWRPAELDESIGDDTTLHSFAPNDTQLVRFLRKIDRKGLGYEGEGPLRGSSSKTTADPDSGNDSSAALSTPTLARQAPAKQKPLRTGLGVGIFNDSGSDDDAYNMGPRISYTRVVGGDKKSKKKTTVSKTANPLLGTRPVFRSKKQLESQTGLRRGHDGRLPFAGFVLVETLDGSSDGMGKGEQYQMPEIPTGWKSSKMGSQDAGETYLSTADAAKASKLDAKARAELLGESLLPGKSVFDFISSTARDRLAMATGRSNLPAGLGEMPAADALPDRLDDSMLPPLSKEIALAALGRGIGGWMPYADNEAKRLRYRVFMEYCGGLRQQMPDRSASVAMDAWLQELREFAHAAEVFKPMTGMMASRFTSATTLPGSGSGSAADAPLLSTPTAASKPEDPAEAAAKLGMFGPLTRSAYRFFPTRLVCKRFNIPPPVHADEAGEASSGQGQSSAVAATSELVAASTMEQMRQDVTRSHPSGAAVSSPDLLPEGKTEAGATGADLRADTVDVSHNEALEAEKPGEAVFKAIFGDDSDSE